MTITLELTKGYTAIIDDCDADLIEVKWCVSAVNKQKLYVMRRVEKRTVYLHRVILSRILAREMSPNEQVDHIDSNGLNNCRNNLRLASNTTNVHNRRRQSNNTSGFKGVSWHKGHSKWSAAIGVNGKKLHLGYFDMPEEAHEVYVMAAKELYGEFANPG